MKQLLRHSLYLAMILMLVTSFGCSTKRVGEEDPEAYDRPITGDLTNDEMAAAQQITNGIVYFEYDSFELRSDAKTILSQKAALMKKFPQLRVTIEGHCDERGTEEYNLALGERRARAAYDFLVNLGVSSSQLEMVSFGKLHPAQPGSSEASWAMNRRDEFKVTKF